jgi:hypothetical protein
MKGCESLGFGFGQTRFLATSREQPRVMRLLSRERGWAFSCCSLFWSRELVISYESLRLLSLLGRGTDAGGSFLSFEPTVVLMS